MTDATTSAVPAATPASGKGSLMQQDARTRKRNAAEARFKAYGIAAITIGMLMLLIL
ncbi:MAG: DUF3333 domain-containing protein, partial [Pseudomonadota bacterium]